VAKWEPEGLTRPVLTKWSPLHASRPAREAAGVHCAVTRPRPPFRRTGAPSDPAPPPDPRSPDPPPSPSPLPPILTHRVARIPLPSPPRLPRHRSLPTYPPTTVKRSGKVQMFVGKRGPRRGTIRPARGQILGRLPGRPLAPPSSGKLENPTRPGSRHGEINRAPLRQHKSRAVSVTRPWESGPHRRAAPERDRPTSPRSPPGSPVKSGSVQIKAASGLRSVARNNKATRLRTRPGRSTKSSAKDLSLRTVKLQSASRGAPLRGTPHRQPAVVLGRSLFVSDCGVQGRITPFRHGF
jgi:hypothetical protein